MDEARWRKLTDWPLLACAVVFLVAYSWEVLADLRGTERAAAESVMAVIWVAFLVDYVVRLSLASPRWPWFRAHLPDLAIVLLPFLRPLRLIRLVALFAILQRTTGGAFRGRVVQYAIGASVLIVYLGALAMVDAERGHGDIDTLGEGLWWALVTITTVGYGDMTPVTTTGQLVAAAVMFAGIALLGVVTASFASWIVDRVAQHDASEQAATRAQVDELTREVRALRVELARAGTQDRVTTSP
ncbi:voltage-gated potassium channel [Agromyces rhizosphaerae]|uniref:Voltage-gated potassium channel n=1 Tax=Agromyces rhizosphaerae TaxID=88374 RepID=A0A9W6CVM4_9MICO|nr:potassium channel family protein [Agromyces rhizosphaerae]GLI27327.1 voltage-gated potassium channel [Agromyces rhizosphaerae]